MYPETLLIGAGVLLGVAFVVREGVSVPVVSVTWVLLCAVFSCLVYLIGLTVRRYLHSPIPGGGTRWERWLRGEGLTDRAARKRLDPDDDEVEPPL